MACFLNKVSLFPRADAIDPYSAAIFFNEAEKLNDPEYFANAWFRV